MLYVDHNPAMQSLMVKVSQRLKAAHRPRTTRAYDKQFSSFLAFSIVMTRPQLHDLDLLLAFIECLAYNGLSLALLKIMFRLLNINSNYILCLFATLTATRFNSCIGHCLLIGH